MEVLNKQFDKPSGPKLLSYFMTSKEHHPTAQEVHKFFKHNMAAIRRVIPNINEREAIREELKDFFEALVDQPLNNRLSECYQKWRKVSPGSQFGVLLEVAGKEMYTTIDLASGFFQIPIEEKSKEITAFIIPKGLYQYNVTPMGLSGSPSTFQRVMEENFGEMRENVMVYLDDIIIFGKRINHIRDVEKVFEKLKEVGMKAKLKKCVFFKEKVEFLGHIISRSGIEINPKKIEAIEKLKSPTNRKELRSFLGATNYFRRFILNYAKIAAPLTHLLSEKREYKWTEEQEVTFKILKEKLKQAPILAPPDLNRNFIIHTDASEYAISGVLLQPDKNDNYLRIISCASRTLNDIEKRWQVVEKEALVYAVKFFKYYIEGKTTDVYTDQRALLAIKSARENQTKLRRYQLVLTSYNLNIYYKEGKANVLADLLSRNPYPEDSQPDINASVLQVELYHNNMNRVPDSIEKQLTLTEEEMKMLKEKYQDQIRLINNIGYIIIKRREKVYVPVNKREKLIHEYHTDPQLGGHFGVKRITELLKRYYWWENMKVEINFEKCQKVKFMPNTTTTWIGAWDPPENPWERLNMDIRGKLTTTKKKNEYFITIVDDFSKYSLAIPIQNTKSKTIVDTLITHVFAIFGYPKQIRMDNATYFTSDYFRNTMMNSGVDLRFSVAYNHESNGEVERFNRTLNEALACYDAGENWDLIVPIIAHTYNQQYNPSIKAVPYEVIFGRKKNTIDGNLKLLNHLNDPALGINHEELIAQVKNILNEDFKVKKVEKHQIFKKGDIVLRKILNKPGNETKLSDRYDGPFVIISIHPQTGNCELSGLLRSGRISHHIIKGKRTYIHAHTKQLKKFKSNNGINILSGDKTLNEWGGQPIKLNKRTPNTIHIIQNNSYDTIIK